MFLKYFFLWKSHLGTKHFKTLAFLWKRSSCSQPALSNVRCLSDCKVMVRSGKWSTKHWKNSAVQQQDPFSWPDQWEETVIMESESWHCNYTIPWISGVGSLPPEPSLHCSQKLLFVLSHLKETEFLLMHRESKKFNKHCESSIVHSVTRRNKFLSPQAVALWHLCKLSVTLVLSHLAFAFSAGIFHFPPPQEM